MSKDQFQTDRNVDFKTHSQGDSSNGSNPSTSDYDGVWTAMVTPFRPDGELDLEAFDSLLKRQERAGVKGVVICGTTGEAPTLSVQEKLTLIRRARAHLDSSVRLMAGTGGNNTSQSVELSKLAEAAGADCLLIVTPPYNKPSTAGLVGHFTQIAGAVNLPLCLYHVPGRTAHSLSVEQIAAICAIDAVQVVKEASGDLGFFARAKGASAATFLTGDDPTILASLAVGSRGVISVVANLFPRATVQLVQAFFDGNFNRALELHEALLPALDSLYLETNPGPIKAALADRQLCDGYLRPPLAKITPSTAAKMQEILRLQTPLIDGLMTS